MRQRFSKIPKVRPKAAAELKNDKAVLCPRRALHTQRCKRHWIDTLNQHCAAAQERGCLLRVPREKLCVYPLSHRFDLNSTLDHTSHRAEQHAGEPRYGAGSPNESVQHAPRFREHGGPAPPVRSASAPPVRSASAPPVRSASAPPSRSASAPPSRSAAAPPTRSAVPPRIASSATRTHGVHRERSSAAPSRRAASGYLAHSAANTVPHTPAMSARSPAVAQARVSEQSVARQAAHAPKKRRRAPTAAVDADATCATPACRAGRCVGRLESAGASPAACSCTWCIADGSVQQRTRQALTRGSTDARRLGKIPFEFGGWILDF